MKTREIVLNLSIACLSLSGCMRPPPPAPPIVPTPAPKVQQPQPPPPPVVEEKPKPIPQVKKRTPEQIQMFSDFAIKESPKIWQTIQAMRGQMTDSGTKIRQLREDLLEFDRNPDEDEDYKALVAGLMELKRAYDAIFDKLEDAYIAAKKYEASPSRKDYQDTMKRALEDGIQDANMATERYKAMTRQK